MNYTNGSPCDQASDHLIPRKLNGDYDDEDDDRDDDRKSRKPSSGREPARRKSTIISFICDRDSLAPKAHLSFLGTIDECTYFFEARSMAACGGIIDPQQSLGPGGVFGVIALIAAIVYLLGGIAYQRTVMHQRGWRQLPNYTLWAGIFGFVNVSIP
jgi:cation-dependent mannose-6-phosphate receptor